MLQIGSSIEYYWNDNLMFYLNVFHVEIDLCSLQTLIIEAKIHSPGVD